MRISRKGERRKLRVERGSFIFFGVLMFFGISFSSLAQLVGFPVGPDFSKNTPNNARVEAVQLPFFDDFSLSSNGRLDPALWQIGGGTYVSNTNTINHPTRNVVTFDGTDVSGLPYVFNNQNAQGATDTLTSQTIDLKGLVPADSVYLSFYWQSRGLGELPDVDDSLRVQFRDMKGNWQTVWKQKGGVQNANFNYSFIALRDLAYFYADFQFRFQAFGRQSGRFDTWHIDYVYLNTKRKSADRFVRDVAVRLPVSSFLKRYSAMPLKQYLAKPAAETADSVFTDIRNLFNVFNFTTFTYTLRDEITRKTIQTFRQTNSEAISSLSSQIKSAKPALLTIADSVKKMALVSEFQLLTTDSTNSSIPGIDLRRNDSISGKTVLDNYYAYDDGTAEYAVYLNRPLGRTAVRYVLNRPDSVSAVRMNIVPILKNLADQPLTIQVWSNLNGKPNALLAQKSVRVQYAANRNAFVEFPLDFGVAVRDTFYVGWLQIGQDGVAVGLDRNNRREDQIFVNLGQEWIPYTNFRNDPNLTFFNGSLLVRPVMGGKPLAPITAIEEKEKQPEWTVFPNPTDGIVRWETDDIRQIEVLNSVGVSLRQISNNTQKQLNLSELPDGFYLLKLSNNKKMVVKKVLLRK